eukprot:maker-scaffold71_size417697-snap-gene-3.16 protein:Tk11817 transcript:maker-scaffold71_size417697-snap-gene-3.16-mRNA-1 annotation:"long-wavelength rhodopsin"
MNLEEMRYQGMGAYLVPKLLLPLMSAKLSLMVTPSKLGPKSKSNEGTLSLAWISCSTGTFLKQATISSWSPLSFYFALSPLNTENPTRTMAYGQASADPAMGTISGLYLDDEYYLRYPKGMKMTDGIPDDVMEVVDPHWSQFAPANPLIPHFFGIMFFFLWIISFLGNGCVIYIFLKVKSLRTPTNMFVINLALSDLIMMTTMGPPVTINVFMQRYWAWGAFGCKLYGFTGAVCGVVSILSMVVIGYDRYNVIVKGFNGVKITSGKALAILFAIWGYSVGISLPPLLNIWGGFTTEGMLFTCSYDYLNQDFNHKSYQHRQSRLGS